MPYARISLLKGQSTDFIAALSVGVQRALVTAFEVPQQDCFQVIHQHERHELVFDRHYLCGPRSDSFVLIAITAGRPRARAVKQAFYRCLVDILAESPGIRPEDVMVVMSTTDAADWSFGRGQATMIRGEHA
jgi:hypothetical protein